MGVAVMDGVLPSTYESNARSAAPGALDPHLDGIMKRYANGDAMAFNALYDAVGERLYRFCLRLTRRPHEADDLFQDALLRLHRARASYVPGATPIPWLLAITRSAYLDRLRHDKRRPQDALAKDDGSEHEFHAPNGASPEQGALARAMLAVVERELEKLSETNRSAYVLVREEGLSVAEAAAVLGTSNDVVKQRAHRADEQIRAALRSAGWTE